MDEPSLHGLKVRQGQCPRTQESERWPCASPVAELEKDLRLCLGSTIQLTLWTGHRWSCSVKMCERSDPIPHLPYGRTDKREMPSSIPHPLSPVAGWRRDHGLQEWINWPCTLPNESLRKADSCLGKTIDLVLEVQVQVSPSWGCESRRASPTSCFFLQWLS